MPLDFSFFFTNIALGAGLAMDAFSVSLANGLHDPAMKGPQMCRIALVFGAFQFAMPVLGWFCVSSIAQLFRAFEPWIPFIALVLLGYIGGKMLYEGLRGGSSGGEAAAVDLRSLLVQGVATSIDALSVGFTISHYTWAQALLAGLLIGGVTFLICLVGLHLGKKAGTRLAGRAGVLGGVILILIGVEIFVSNLL